jgi:beta-glucosidase-like glycosyl hydrolase
LSSNATNQKKQLAPTADAPLRDKLAQLIFVRIGSNLPPVRTVTDDEERIARLLQTCPLGGLVLFNGSFAETPRTLAKLQAASRYLLLVGADLERGAGQQLRGLPLLPHAMAFEALGGDAAAAVRRFAELTAVAARAAGVHIVFGPVADVNSDPRNPIIATRAFGTEPRRVAELVAAFVEGCRAGGALAAAKHFPGHGNTFDDSHHALPTVDGSGDVLRARDLPPFRAAIAADVPLIMTAHIRYPAFDPSGAAATVSREILTGLLRDELRFQGAIVSDSLLMEGAKAGYASGGELALAALLAGVDVLLDVADPVEALDRLEEAVAAGRLDVARVDAALSRVTRLKHLALDESPPPFEEAANRAATEQLAVDVARRAISIAKNEGSVLPLRADRGTCAVFVNPFPLPSGADPPVLGAALRARFPRLAYHEIGAAVSADELNAIGNDAAAAEQFVAAIVVKPAAWHRFGLPPHIREWLEDLIDRRPTVVACLGAPQGLEPFAAASGLMCALSDVPVSQAALVDALTAQTDALPR